MPSSSCDILIIGAGVLGLATAAELALRGRAVTVVDPGAMNASRVAAGMIAPALEAAIEDVTPERAALLKAARDLWPRLAEAAGVRLHWDGAEWHGPDAPAMAARMKVLGFEAWMEGEAAFTPEDWFTAPDPALAALAAVNGVTVRVARVAALEQAGETWRARLDDGSGLEAETVILATGAAEALPGLPSPARRLVEMIRPIRGQLDFVEGLDCPRVRRAPGVYVVPAEGGVVIGATMDHGRRDLDADPAQSEGLLAAAGRLVDIGGAGARHGFVGVRGATPDGLPMAGRIDEGLFAALAPRRNGWLLAPAVAAVVADAVQGKPTTAFAAAFDPIRF